MNALYPLPAFGELRGYYRDAAIAAEKRGDAEAAQANADEAAGLLARVMPPRLMPDTMDDLRSRRKDARSAAELAEFVELDRHASLHRAFVSRLTARINERVDA